jgi:uncharacterized protein YjbJ (UPF0337 family)
LTHPFSILDPPTRFSEASVVGIPVALTPIAQVSLYYQASQRRNIMNWDQIKGGWKQFQGKVKEKWGKLTDDDLTVIGGKKDQLLGKLQQKYGYDKEQAEKEVDSFLQGIPTK